MRKLVRILTSRLFITSLFILFQLIFLVALVLSVSAYSIYIQIFLTILSLILVICKVSEDSNPMFKLAWVIPMLIAPVFGWLLYIVFERRKVPKKTLNKYMDITVSSKNLIKQDKSILEELEKQDEGVLRECRYILKTAHTPIFKNTSTHFLPTGEEFFEEYLNRLKEAKKFIFLEYFIIDEGHMWGEILNILIEKAQAGLDVRVMYDDLGTINLLSRDYNKKLRRSGIKVAVFNPFRASLDTFMNYRDHRKITVIDGNTAFTGGLNIADEYVNLKVRHGYWKDCALLLKGEAVSSLTLMFLQLWFFASNDSERVFNDFIKSEPVESDGYVQPFGDGPMAGHLTGELAYMNIINNAKQYVYISTPYLILDNEMLTALKLAAHSGIDVRIITPNTPDKWYVHYVTRSNYNSLISAGVKIYEYLPGFIHAKTIIADDTMGIVGTTNFDFRSFYLHFENGVFMYKTKAILEVKKDYENMLNECLEITPEFCVSTSLATRLIRSILKLFSPLM